MLDWSYVSKKWATFCALSCCCQTANPETNSPSLSHQGYKIASFPGGSDSKASAYNAGGLGSIPGSGRSPGEGNGNLFQYSCLENPVDGRSW